MKRLFGESPYFTLKGSFGKFQVYCFRDFPASYIEVREPEDVVLLNESAGGRSADFYRYFREYELSGSVFVPSREAGGLVGKFREYSSYTSMSADRPRDANFEALLSRLSPLRSLVSNEYLDPFTIGFDTEAIGKPHIIRVYLRTGIQIKNGEKIFPVSPGFMMIIPESKHVELFLRTEME